ncbi:MAG: alpha/beta fold hydrolase [Actinomycetota bacterium]
MQASTTHIWTPARVTALVLIALLTLGLINLRFAPDASVSVPAGARAGDLVMDPCTYATDNGTYDADCGTLVVPENRADPKSRLIALPVTRIRALSDDPGEPVFRLEGGPGITNMDFPRASRFAGNHDVVLVGYRGVDGSVRLDCPEVASALKRSTDFLGEKSFRAHADGYRACADRLTHEGIHLASYGLVQQVDDLEAARVALGYDRIDLVSESAGTRTALIYSWRYPESIHRSVLIGVNPPGHFVWNRQTSEEQVGRYAEQCSKDTGCSQRSDDLAATMGRTASDLPDRWFLLPINKGNVLTTSFYGLIETTSELAPLNAPTTIDAWLSAAEGDASGFWLMSLAANLFFPDSFVWGQYAAAASLDAPAARDYFSSGGQERDSVGYAASAFAWAGGRLADAWPTASEQGKYDRVRTSDVEALLIGGALDLATPPQVATKELLPYLPKAHEVVLPGFGHSTSFWAEQPEAGSHLINTFFDSGKVDGSLYEPQSVDFTPEVTQTAVAKGIAGAMLGSALLTVLSLLWMARRVHKRGRFARKTGALLRSLYSIVLGFGGWFLGALIVLTTIPGVPLDDELLAVLSIGVPVGLGIYWSWVPGDLSGRRERIGLAAAASGALAGAWLGFDATDGLLVVVTAVAGAVAGANLTLIIFDMSRARSARDMLATTTVDVRPDREPVGPR